MRQVLFFFCLAFLVANNVYSYVLLLQEVQQLELLCTQLYESQDPNIRVEAEKALVVFQNSPDALSKCQLLLERSESSYAQLLACTTLTKIISRSSQNLPLQQRIDIRKFQESTVSRAFHL